MLIKRPGGIASSEITDPGVYLQRRQFLVLAAAAALGGGGIGQVFAGSIGSNRSGPGWMLAENDKLNTLSEITRYNNYYEFSTNKEAVYLLARALTTKPWTITVEGEVEQPITLDVDGLKRLCGEEERIYRLRCIEGWSMVIPWSGFSLSKLLSRARPTSQAKYVEFVSLLRPEEMIGQRMPTLDWPYREGLRMDEAMHPLTLVATGLYGQSLPSQNGAPLRVVTPWKYGFKSPKAITHIRLLRSQPETSWMKAAPSEYGFYANVNPDVPHPRWSQQRENRIGELHKRPTLPFNGYADEVAHLYRGIDLQKFF